MLDETVSRHEVALRQLIDLLPLELERIKEELDAINRALDDIGRWSEHDTNGAGTVKAAARAKGQVRRAV